MISIILYGRNDSYGYNLHKRGALSLNCMAEVLTDPADEILFVDYNTPDDFPTFPEAIADTLTPRARNMLRIFRVRSHIHARFKARTRLVALEPVARNVALRRALPANRWILSTNTDVIFVLRRMASLSDVARGLKPGLYHAPRIEIPEALWETFDRQAPGDVIGRVADWGSSLHLNEIFLGPEVVHYNDPGDFQLLPRSDLFDNHGFNEDMLLGWHVDSNLAARMRLKYRELGDLGGDVHGYHCDHTKQLTPMHGHTRTQNDWETFVEAVERPDLRAQAATWGCAGDDIEEIRLPGDGGSVYVRALRDVIGEPLAAPVVVEYSRENFNKADYDSRHLLPFLADMFVSMPRSLNVAWYGARSDTLTLFAQVWRRLGFTGAILLGEPRLQGYDGAEQVRHAPEGDIFAQADVFVFDFGGLPEYPRRSGTPASPARKRRSRKPADPPGSIGADLRKSFHRVVAAERSRLAAANASRRVIAINAVNNDYESLVSRALATAATPYASHIRYGFVTPPKSALRKVEDTLARLRKSARRRLRQIRRARAAVG